MPAAARGEKRERVRWATAKFENAQVEAEYRKRRHPAQMAAFVKVSCIAAIFYSVVASTLGNHNTVSTVFEATAVVMSYSFAIALSVPPVRRAISPTGLYRMSTAFYAVIMVQAATTNLSFVYKDGYSAMNLARIGPGVERDLDVILAAFWHIYLVAVFNALPALELTFYYFVVGSYQAVFTYTYFANNFDLAVPLTLFLLIADALLLTMAVSTRRQDRRTFLFERHLEAQGVTITLTRDSLFSWAAGGKVQQSGMPSWLIESDEIEFGDVIGQGSYGRVIKGRWRGTAVAVKELVQSASSNHTGAVGLGEWIKEISLLAELRHPNIVQFLAVSRSAGALLLVTELLELGSVADLLQRAQLRPQGVATMALGACRGLRYLHNLVPPLIHQDVKPGNLLVDKTLTVKVADFGLARLASEDGAPAKRGTLSYQSPELIRNPNETSGQKADVYAFGITMWELGAGGKRPFEELFAEGATRVAMSIFVEDLRPVLSDLIPDMPNKYLDLMRRCWDRDPQRRPTFDEANESLERVVQSMPTTVASSASGLGSNNMLSMLSSQEDGSSETEAPRRDTPVAAVAVRVEHMDALWLDEPMLMSNATHELVHLLRTETQGGYIVEPDASSMFVVVFSQVDRAFDWLKLARERVLAIPLPDMLRQHRLVKGEGLALCAGVHYGMPSRILDPVTNRAVFFGPVLERVRELCTAAYGQGTMVSTEAKEQMASQLLDHGSVTVAPPLPDLDDGVWRVSEHGSKLPPIGSEAALGEARAVFSIPWSEVHDLGKSLGKGSTGTVYQAIFRGDPVAVKKLHAAKLSDRQMLSFRREAAVMRVLKHDRVVGLVAACFEAPNFALVMKRYARSLRSVLRAEGGIQPDSRRQQILRDVAAGMAYVHSMNVVHLNLKPSNVLLDKDERAAVSDFGMAQMRVATATMTAGGSGWHVAPEVLSGHGSSRKSDVYSFGVLVHQLDQGAEPLWSGEGLGEAAALGRIVRGERPPTDNALVRSCWAQEADKRPTFDEVVVADNELPQTRSNRPEKERSVGAHKVDVLPH